MRPAVPVLLLLTFALAGCAGGGGGGDGGAGANDPGGASPGGANGGNVTDPGAAPTWQVGQSWTHDWTIGSSTQFQVESIVVDAGAGGYRLAAATDQDAANHAAFFFHTLGQMDAGWTVHQGDYAYPWYSFPLTDGKTWTATESNLDFNLNDVQRELKMTARLVNGTGGVPTHYMVEQRTSDGGLRALYDYRPDLDWFSSYSLFDPAQPDSPPQLTLKTSAAKTGYKGDYFEATSDFLLNTFSIVSPAGAQASGDPYSSFTITADHTHVLAIVFAFAAAGASHAELVAPDGQHWEANHVADADGNTLGGNGGLQVLVPAVAGDWRFANGGASPFAAGSGCYAWGVTVTQGTL